MPTLEITTVASCTVRCTYCPQDALKAAYPKGTAHRLALDDFRVVLGKLPPYVRVDFSGFVEPWLNPACTAMLREALVRGYSVGVYTTLQGMADAADVAHLLAEHAAQVEVLCLHLPDANGNMTGHRDGTVWRGALATITALRGHLRRFEVMTMDSAGAAAPDVPTGRLLPWVGNDRAGALQRGQVAGQPLEPQVHHQQPVACSFTPFYDQNVLLPNGDVVLCCMDYGLRHKLGNLLHGGWEDLDRGKMHEANMRPEADTACKRCTRAVRYTTAPGARQQWVGAKP